MSVATLKHSAKLIGETYYSAEDLLSAVELELEAEELLERSDEVISSLEAETVA